MSVPVRSAVLITASEPEPRSFGKQVVIGGLLDHLCRRLNPMHVHVLVIGSDRPRPATPYVVHVVPQPGPTEQVAAVLTRTLLPPFSPFQEAALWSGPVRRDLEHHLGAIDADLEIWDTMRVGQYARYLPHRGRRVLYADDLFSKRYASMRERIRTDRSRMNPLGEFGQMLPGVARRLAATPMVYRPLLALEERLTARSEERAPAVFDATVLVNPTETEELTLRSGSDTVRTLLPLLRQPGQRERRFDGTPTFVFLGGLDFPPNRDGLTWFLRECREPVLAAVPGFRLLVAGRATHDLPREADAWQGRVRPLGWVEDLDDLLLGAAALISPLRIGSGIKIKVLEALARGLPVVATPHGVLGLDVGPHCGCLVATEPEDLARLLARAADPVQNATLSAGASACWQHTYGPAVAARAYDEVLGLGTPQPVSAG
ncbi:MAG TPA: glycosyltransferase family 4 protein [Propionibacteriaceae bacterium]|nr:glycosyltransferase family 4 protein [Propionibacteriaceae bacterium]